jgi:hypothetical protein
LSLELLEGQTQDAIDGLILGGIENAERPVGFTRTNI